MDSLALAVAIPVVTAAILVGVGGFVRGRVADLVALAAVIAALTMLVLSVAKIGFGTEVYWFGAWQPRGGIALGVDFAVNGIGAGMAILIALLTTAALVLMWRYRDTDAPHFQVLMLLFFAGMVGFSLSGDLFNMFVFFELMSVAAFALAGYRVESESIEGSLNFAVTNTIGSFLILIGIALVYARTGALNLA